MALPAAIDFTGGWVTEAQFKTAMTDLVEYLEDLETTPVGGVVAFAMSTAPAGFLKANGAEISRTTFAALFAKIGTTFGAGDGSITFNLPDLRGEFIRGWDDGRWADPDRVFGSPQADDLKAHTHTQNIGGTVSSQFSTVTSSGPGNASRNTGSTGGTETRPRNVALLYAIKY